MGRATTHACCKYKKHCHDSEAWLHVLVTNRGYRHNYHAVSLVGKTNIGNCHA